MANLMNRESRARGTLDWDPAILMRELLPWDPFLPLRTLEVSRERTFNPAFEVRETKEGYLFRGDLPGVKEQDLDITLTGSRLTISGKREGEKAEQGESFFVLERSYGAFSRSFTLPEGIDGEQVRAELKEGVLTLLVPKLPEVKTRKIGLAER